MSCRLLFRSTLDSYVDYFLQYSIEEALNEHDLEALIELLEGNFVNHFPLCNSTLCS